MTFALTLLVPSALAGYGDLDQEGNPVWADRDLHVWTNAVRVEPDAFEAEFNQGGCSWDDFSGDEQRAKAPLYLDTSLNEAADYHTKDMVESGEFSHSSSDGTSFGERLARFYSDSSYVGENIAYGYGSGYNAVLVGWMCSTDGHRANIMSGDYTELGTGVLSDHYTQDFGAGSVETDSPVAMVNHTPQSPGSEATVYADWQDGDAPARFELVLDGEPRELVLVWGEAEQGMYGDVAPVSDDVDCHQYYVEWEDGSGETGRYPETGSYTFGSGCEDEIGWIPDQMCVYGRDCRDLEDLASGIELVGCASAGGRAGPWATLLGAIAVLARRTPLRRFLAGIRRAPCAGRNID